MKRDEWNPLSTRQRSRFVSLAPLAVAIVTSLMAVAAEAADECGTGSVIECLPIGSPYSGGITYTAPSVALTVRSGTVVDTTSVLPLPNSVQTTLGIGVRAGTGTATPAGALAVTVEAGASIIAPHASLIACAAAIDTVARDRADA